MSDSNRDRSYFYQDLPGPDFTTSYVGNSPSILHYSHTYGNNTGGIPSIQSQVMGYGDVDGYGSGNDAFIHVERATVTAGGRWSNEYTVEQSSSNWASEPSHWNEGANFGYSMTGREDVGGFSEAVGTFENHDGGRYQEQPKYDGSQNMESVPYAHTSRNDNGWPGNLQTSEIEQQSATYQQVDHNSDIDRGPPQQIVSCSESNYTPSTCPLEGCRGIFIYPTFQSFRTHQKTIHHKNIFCHISECNRSHTTAFHSENDRRRHHTAKHEKNPIKQFRCQRDVCPARVKAFSRSDKLLAHDQKYHRFPCQSCS